MTNLLQMNLMELPLNLQLAMGAIVFMAGASIGSFLSAAIYRATTSHKSIVLDRSECTSCGRKLGFFDLIPIFSFLFLRAKCRSCHEPISWRYFFIELTCAVLTTLIVFQTGFSLVSLERIVAIGVLMSILFIDLDTWLIPVLLPLFLVFWGVAFGLLEVDALGLNQRLIGAGAGFGFLAVTLVVSTFILRRTGRLQADETAMGWGDPILMAGIGALVGPKVLVFVLWLACAQAIVAYMILKVRARDFAIIAQDAHAEQEFTPPARALPLGTFLCLAAIEIMCLQVWL